MSAVLTLTATIKTVLNMHIMRFSRYTQHDRIMFIHGITSLLLLFKYLS